jgi:hypothetical protein
LSASPTPGNDPCHTSGTPVASEKPTPVGTLEADIQSSMKWGFSLNRDFWAAFGQQHIPIQPVNTLIVSS